MYQLVPFRFPSQNSVCIPYFSLEYYVPHPSHHNSILKREREYLSFCYWLLSYLVKKYKFVVSACKLLFSATALRSQVLTGV